MGLLSSIRLSAINSYVVDVWIDDFHFLSVPQTARNLENR